MSLQQQQPPPGHWASGMAALAMQERTDAYGRRLWILAIVNLIIAIITIVLGALCLTNNELESRLTT